LIYDINITPLLKESTKYEEDKLSTNTSLNEKQRQDLKASERTADRKQSPVQIMYPYSSKATLNQPRLLRIETNTKYKALLE